jgi:hypothetical protein
MLTACNEGGLAEITYKLFSTNLNELTAGVGVVT